ncbi:hypothetical protein KSP39_PZI008974 [Platanthera zijinensis]|uniref:Rho GTPase-activating protein 7-like n=1 Tax=Platanthera zijinensis TaxID=2320716 RepID=A0AAP0BMM9_9ASPA
MSSAPAAAPMFERHRLVTSNTVFKSGPLFISSKGIGWKTWKKRWFILTRTSLVFFKSDPSALPQRGGEVNITLGGIDLNNSGSVVVREDKKLLTVLFPDGRDGRAFTLKAETMENLFEWKIALEQALAQAPNAALVMGHNGIFRNENTDVLEGSIQHWRDKRPIKSLVIGRPILLALEDIDGAPSFLEKALRFLEINGTKVEGILRQSADVEEVERRVQEYEQGRTEFAADEDAHVIGDCIKHVLRELPSSPVPASCCNALLEAYRFEHKDARLKEMHSAILNTFPEPNRKLLQRVLKMMHTISAHSTENRMSPSAIAACMAPLLLRPLLAGECELEDDFDINGSNSAQLLAAATAANNAQAIVTTLLEEYENIFAGCDLQRCSISPGSHIEDSDSEESDEDENTGVKDNGYVNAKNAKDPEMDVDPERVLSGKLSESSYAGSDLYDYKVFAGYDSDAESPACNKNSATKTKLVRGSQDNGDGITNHNMNDSLAKKDSQNMLPLHESPLSMGEILSSLDSGISFPSTTTEHCIDRHTTKLNGPHTKRPNFWGRNNARKNPSVDSVDSSGEEELVIQRLEMTKNELRMRIAKEAKGNAILQASLERRKQALHERRLTLEQDVSRLQEQLQAERDLRAALEVGLSMSSGQFSSSRGMDSKTRAELEEISLAEADVARLKKKVAELHLQLNQQRQHQCSFVSDDGDRYQHFPTHLSQTRKVVRQDFDTSLAFLSHEKQRNENHAGSDWRSMMPQTPHLSRKNSGEGGPSDSKGVEASSSSIFSSEETNPMSNTPRSNEGAEYTRPMETAASSTLIELTTRLDFFKERRSQLLEQLHSLEHSHGISPQGFPYSPSSPPWNSPR